MRCAACPLHAELRNHAPHPRSGAGSATRQEMYHISHHRYARPHPLPRCRRQRQAPPLGKAPTTDQPLEVLQKSTARLIATTQTRKKKPNRSTAALPSGSGSPVPSISPLQHYSDRHCKSPAGMQKVPVHTLYGQSIRCAPAHTAPAEPCACSVSHAQAKRCEQCAGCHTRHAPACSPHTCCQALARSSMRRAHRARAAARAAPGAPASSAEARACALP